MYNKHKLDMAKITKIKKDQLGLYVNCGGYVSRPFFGTKFKEGETVKTHHFGGSTNAGVTSPDKPQTHNFRNGSYEYWGTTGISEQGYNKKIFETGYEGVFGSTYSNFEDYNRLQTQWYQNQSKFLASVYKEHNDKFTP